VIPLAVPAALMLQAAASTAGQEFAARTDLVVVDAVVTDRHERPVRGLTRDHFVVREQGAVRTVETFEAVDHLAVKEPLGPTSTAVSLADPRAEPHIVIYVDDLDVTRPQAERAAAGAEAAIVAAGRTSAQVWLVCARRGVVAAGRVPDEKEALLAVLRSAVGGSGPPLVANARFREQGTVEAIEQVLAALPQASGRNALLLISPGLPYPGAIEPGMPLGARSPRATEDSGRASHDRLLRATRRAAVAVYTLDVTGLVSPFAATSGSLLESKRSALSDAVASATGGLSVRNANDLRAAAAQIVDESLVYYRLGFAPDPGAKTGEFRRIEVELRRPGLSVRARSGYFVEP
jgi:VWFA-related protein